MINVLVYPCSSGVGQEIYFSLLHHKDVNVYGANSDLITPGYFLYEKNYCGNAPPMKNEKECLMWLKNVINEKRIECIFPAYDDAQVWLKERESILGVKIITSPLETVQICRSKKKTYEILNYIRCPIMYDRNNIPEYPIFIKPECGEGSKGCYKINSEDELNTNFTQEHICLEYLPGEEYTVDCFTDSKRNVLFTGARERVLTRAGISILTKGVETTEEIKMMAQEINKNFHLIGAWFFQIKRAKDGTMCLLEIAPRVPGAMAFHREQGINFPILSLYAHNNQDVKIIQPKIKDNSFCCKIYKNYFYFPEGELAKGEIKGIYIDLDDTLLLNEKEVNTNLIGLLYLAKNRGLPIYLITRHKANVEETLTKLCIHINLFTEIYHLDRNTNKSSKITNRPAIFIDDSFRERLEVSEKYDDVYCYDVDGVGAIEGHLRTTPA